MYRHREDVVLSLFKQLIRPPRAKLGYIQWIG
jgi:hypothetical protein